jgi:2,4-diketo-3-deoxy-L-fuconate hydrolase
MRLCFFNDHRFGLVEGDVVRDVSAVLEALPKSAYPYPRHDAVIAALPTLRPRILELAGKAPAVPLASVTLLSPVLNPGKVVAAPVNYSKHLDEAIADPETFSRAHVRQIQETGLFLKATSSLIGASQPVVITLPERRTDHEVELAVIIGKSGVRIPRAEALDHVAGYSIGLDITIRGPEERSLRKSLDTYTVLGPWLVTADEIGDPAGLDLALDIGTEARQRANTRDLILDVPALIEFASAFYTLEPGDILLTGPPEGVGPIKIGDEIFAKIEKIGEMRVAVRGL